MNSLSLNFWYSIIYFFANQKYLVMLHDSKNSLRTGCQNSGVGGVMSGQISVVYDDVFEFSRCLGRPPADPSTGYTLSYASGVKCEKRTADICVSSRARVCWSYGEAQARVWVIRELALIRWWNILDKGRVRDDRRRKK